MSDSDEIKLSAQDLMPDWVTNLEKNLHREFSDRGDAPKGRRDDRDRRGGPRKGFGDRRDSGGRGDRGGRDDRGGRGRDFRGGDRDRDRDRDRNRRGDGPRGRRDDRSGRDDDRRGRDRLGPDERPPAGVSVTVEPSPQAVDALARHIKSTGRTYALAELAKMILLARDRYQVRFRIEPTEGKPLLRCRADSSLWVSRDEAISHLLRGPLLNRYFEVEDAAVEPPKGNFTVVAVCGLSGRILGPPNHHEYTLNVGRLHRERFSDMSLERYKSRIEMRRDEETIEKWKAEVSVQRQYRPRPVPLEVDPSQEPEAAASVDPASEDLEIEPPAADTIPDEGADGEDVESAETGDALESPAVEDPPGGGAEDSVADTTEEESDATGQSSDPSDDGGDETGDAGNPKSRVADPNVLKSTEAVERHFRQHFLEDAIEEVTEAVVPGDIPGRSLSRGLLTLLKNEAERQRRSFPLSMIQYLCREFEAASLKFFKRGKKALHVSVARPRGIPNEEELSDRIREIVKFVREHPKARVVDLLDALVSDYQRPAAGETFEQHHLTEKEHTVLADLRWLTMEGYVIEFPNTQLALGKSDPPPAKAPPAKKNKKEKGAPKARSEAVETVSAADPESGTVSSEIPGEAPPTGEESGAPAGEMPSVERKELVLEETNSGEHSREGGGVALEETGEVAKVEPADIDADAAAADSGEAASQASLPQGSGEDERQES